MTDRKTNKKPTVDQLDLSKETVQDLSESEAGAAAGGKPQSWPQDACQCKSRPKGPCVSDPCTRLPAGKRL
jgi:hypothetical protein